VAPHERATITWSALTDSTAAVALMMTMKTVEKAHRPLLRKPMPKIRMNIGRKIDFGTLKT